MSRFRKQCGQSMVLTLVFMVVLLGMATAVLDVGAWYRAHRQTQATADAAALAGAQELPESTGRAAATAIDYANRNGGGVQQSDIEFSSKVMANDTIKVTARRTSPGVFSRLFGIDSVTARSTAKARSGVPNQARWAAPFAVDEQHPLLQCKPSPCFGTGTRLWADKLGPGAWHWINIDGSKGGNGVPLLEEWIRRGYEGYMPLGWYYSMPGGKRSSQVEAALRDRIGTELLMPVFRATKGNGSNFEYEVVAWVGFHLTGFQLQGSKGSWLDGYFTRLIWEGIQGESASDADYGVRSVSLVE